MRLGFTLLEILIVLVIISVLAGLAMPSYFAQVERVRSSEALNHLTVAKHSLNRYFAQNNSYAGATLSPIGTNLDYNPNIAVGGQNLLFDYRFSAGPTANSYTLRARRLPSGPCGAASPYSIYLDEAGVVSYS